MKLVAHIKQILILLSCFIIANQAAANKHHPWISDSAPTVYIVKKGDTLWDVSRKFLHNPGYWPRVWKNNPDIQNPHLIYPGDCLRLKYVKGKPYIYRDQKNSRVQPTYHHGTVKLKPRIRIISSDNPIPTLPWHVIKAFLDPSRVVSSGHAEHCPQIVALDEDHIIVAKGDRVYVDEIIDTIDDRDFTVFRPNKVYEHPKTHEKLGIEGLVLGKAALEIKGHPASLILTNARQEIRVGDRLMLTPDDIYHPYFIPHHPIGRAYGQIISVFGGQHQASQYQVVVVTGGHDRSRQVGDVMAVYQTQKDLPARMTAKPHKHYDFPPLRVGIGLVFRVFDQVSYILVMEATRPLYLLDVVDKP